MNKKTQKKKEFTFLNSYGLGIPNNIPSKEEISEPIKIIITKKIRWIGDGKGSGKREDLMIVATIKRSYEDRGFNVSLSEIRKTKDIHKNNLLLQKKFFERLIETIGSI
jgi:hypothetical protein